MKREFKAMVLSIRARELGSQNNNIGEHWSGVGIPGSDIATHLLSWGVGIVDLDQSKSWRLMRGGLAGS